MKNDINLLKQELDETIEERDYLKKQLQNTVKDSE